MYGQLQMGCYLPGIILRGDKFISARFACTKEMINPYLTSHPLFVAGRVVLFIAFHFLSGLQGWTEFLSCLVTSVLMYTF